MRYLLILLVLTACASPERKWYKDGSSGEEFERDHGYCTAQGFQGTQSLMQAAIVQNGCMRGKGWQLR